jgi:IS605 OrfB family transposase
MRKRALTAESSSRWAGAITRTSEDQVRLAGQNLRAERISLQVRIRRIEARLAVPTGTKVGRDLGYATPAERHAKAVRLQLFKSRLAKVDRRLDAGAVSVVRGGKVLLRKRGGLARTGLTAPAPPPSLDDLRAYPVVAVDVNHGHLAVTVIAADGNVLGAPATIGLDLDELPSATRDGRLRAAISALIATATARGARAVVIEDLNFAGARAEGRERAGSRPSRGRRGRNFRRAVSAIPTARFRDRLTQMAANAGLSVIVIDPAYTSRWGAEHWLRPMREHHPEATGHHAAALVIGRRGLGHRARRRATGNQTAPEEAARPTPGAAPDQPGARDRTQETTAPRGHRQPPGAKTGRPHRTTAGNQAAQDRSELPTRQDHVLLVQ